MPSVLAAIFIAFLKLHSASGETTQDIAKRVHIDGKSSCSINPRKNGSVVALIAQEPSNIIEITIE